MIKQIFLFWIFLGLSVAGATISPDLAAERALEWMAGNPVMSRVGRSIASIEVFSGEGTYSVYLVRLAPQGYLILNSDDRLPLIVSFSADSPVDLTDDPQNAFRAILIGHCNRMEEELSQPVVLSDELMSAAETELYGPFLETSWGQSAPYNQLCPEAEGGYSSYSGHAPAGCVPVAYAQVLQFHRWPVHGSGFHSYSDASGAVQGPAGAEFSDSYDWKNMKNSYSLSNNAAAELAAVAELMVELGVAAEVDYEADATSGVSTALGNRLGDYFFFEPMSSYDSLGDLIAPLEADLRAGFPCVVSYPGHAFVADGLMVSEGITTYHFNMGWSGANNGWWSAESAPTSTGSSTLNSGVTSLRPRLMAFPESSSVYGEEGGMVDLNWILPKRREEDAAHLAVKQLVQQAGFWVSDASSIGEMNSGWSVIEAGRSGDCWFAESSGPASLVPDEFFVPGESAELTFWQYARLYLSPFTIDVSADGGGSYETIYSTEETVYEYSWSRHSVTLADYAGQRIRLRFKMAYGGAYSGDWAGVRVDDLSVTSGDWFDWAPFAQDDTMVSRRFSSVSSSWDECDDFSVFDVTSTSTYNDWTCSTTSDVSCCFYKPPGGYSNREYHLTSGSTITPTAFTRLMLRAKYNLAGDVFRVLLSTDRSTFTEIWTGGGRVDWSDIGIDLSAYAGEAIYIRLEYVAGSYYSAGGVWIDSVSTQEITNSELEGQPVYSTTLTNLVEGTYTLAAVLTSTRGVEQLVGPSFDLTVSSVSDDGDGMPSEWELLYGLDPVVDDGALDPDDDGYSNFEEYLCNTAPTNAASCWLVGVGDEGLPVFYASTGRVYTVRYCRDLMSNQWLPLVSGLAGSNDVINVEKYDAATNSARFYRIEINLID